MRSLAATISLKVSATLPMRPTWWPAIRTEKSPTRMAWSACRRSRRSEASPPASGPAARLLACEAAAVAALEPFAAPVSDEVRGMKVSEACTTPPDLGRRDAKQTALRATETTPDRPQTVGHPPTPRPANESPRGGGPPGYEKPLNLL